MQEYRIPKEQQETTEYNISGTDFVKPVGDYSLPGFSVSEKKKKKEPGKKFINKLKVMLYISAASVVSVAAVTKNEETTRPPAEIIEYVDDVVTGNSTDDIQIDPGYSDDLQNISPADNNSDTGNDSDTPAEPDPTIKSETAKDTTVMPKEPLKPANTAKEIVCPVCNGLGTFCALCGGDGIFDCMVCNNGIETCVVCHGAGWHVCYGCGGSGLWPCLSCNQTGVLAEFGGITCPSCGGDGIAGACPHCGGTGRETCEECGGNGSYLCMHCHGKLWEVCPECKGNPPTCTYCNGAGKLIDLETE